MNVLLVRPKAPNLFRFSKLVENEPIELEYLMTALKAAGHNATIYDGIFDKRSLKVVIKLLNPDMVGITGYITQQEVMKDAAKLAKRLKPEIITVVGGVHVQLNPEVFKTPYVDYLYRSASVEGFSELVRMISEARGVNTSGEITAADGRSGFSEIDGLVYRASGDASASSWKANPLAPYDINRLPIPDRTYFYWNRYRYRFLNLREVATVKTAFSCPQNCAFCYCKQLNGGKYQTRVLDAVIEEIASLETDAVQIVDDDFLADIPRAWAFVEKVKAAGIRKNFVCYARADEVASNPELIKALQGIGFRYFIVGLEAIDDAVLKDYRKQTTEEINRRCVQTIKAAGAECIALMMISHTARKADFDAIYNWAKENELVYTTVSIFTPIPGTPLYEQYAEQITCKKIEHWDFLHLVLKPTQLSKFMFYYQYIKLTAKLILLGLKNEPNVKKSLRPLQW